MEIIRLQHYRTSRTLAGQEICPVGTLDGQTDTPLRVSVLSVCPPLWRFGGEKDGPGRGPLVGFSMEPSVYERRCGNAGQGCLM